MDKKKVNRYIIYFILTLIVFSSVFFYFEYVSYINEINYKREEIIEVERGNTQFEISSVTEELETIVSDLIYLAKSFEEEYSSGRDVESIMDSWMNFADAKLIYDQIRVIDANGFELLRINNDTNTLVSSAVDAKRLQDKSMKPYFLKPLDLADDEVYISVLDLNMEHGKVELPIKPMLRFSKKVYNADGELLGVIVLNYRASNIIDKFYSLSELSFGEVSVVNSSGYYIYSKYSDKNWAFMFPRKSIKTYSDDFPKVWDYVSDKTEGEKICDDKLVIFSEFDISKLKLFNGKIKCVTDEKPFKIITYIKNDGEYRDYIEEENYKILFNFLYNSVFKLTLVLVVSLLVAYFLFKNAEKKEEMEHLSTYDSLTEVYNRRAGYEKVKKMYMKSCKKGKPFSICFIDINGLKLINDNLGHEFGDEIIVTVSDVIKSEIRESDVLIRLGGDEFLLAFSASNLEMSELIWLRIVGVFNNINMFEDRPYNISVSHGIVELFDINDQDIEDAVVKADELMYEEKKKMKEDIIIIK